MFNGSPPALPARFEPVTKLPIDKGFTGVRGLDVLAAATSSTNFVDTLENT
jgi:hypothetical protein